MVTGKLRSQGSWTLLARFANLNRSQSFGIDALLAPAGRLTSLIHPVNGDRCSGPSANTPAAVAGYPQPKMLMGQVAGLAAGQAAGLTFFGSAWQHVRLLVLGLHFEQATRHRTPPARRPAQGPEDRQVNAAEHGCTPLSKNARREPVNAPLVVRRCAEASTPVP